ncbi:MAG: hypothetical protein P1V35_12270 [Planctomycetota bacterium]|nr:hypothetical protein [Planctomycetota bacterium]
MKFTQRLDYGRLAEALTERDMVALASIQELLKASNEGGQAFPEALVESNLIPDWDLSRVVCDVFHLPFLPLDQAKPDKELLALFNKAFLQSSALVPVSRYGNVLTIAMPAIVQADTLALLSAETDMFLLPIVSTVSSNRKWLEEHCPVQKFGEDSSWGNLFDEGDQAVQETLGNPTESLDTDENFDLGSLGEETDSEDMDLGDLVLDSTDLDFGEPDSDLMEAATNLLGGDLGEDDGGMGLEFESDGNDDTGPADLPPMPDFNS